ncbi:MAG: hypothetical protein D6686_17080, partial [Alphaproteobacteria bacterium]
MDGKVDLFESAVAPDARASGRVARQIRTALVASGAGLALLPVLTPIGAAGAVVFAAGVGLA